MKEWCTLSMNTRETRRSKPGSFNLFSAMLNNYLKHFFSESDEDHHAVEAFGVQREHAADRVFHRRPLFHERLPRAARLRLPRHGKTVPIRSRPQRELVKEILD